MLLSKPIKSIQEVLNFDSSVLLKHKNTPYKSERWRNTEGVRMLMCQDMKGGYLEGESSLEGCGSDGHYLFWHWWQVDVFVYFSHHLVTIPPHSWIQAAHKHGVKILGTFITERKEGSDICTEIFKSEECLTAFADKLVDISSFYDFDGWLLNIENSLQPEETEKMVKFTEHLRQKQHEACAWSEVVWYDSVTVQGELFWQNQLNQLNLPFFNACDGIFLNYTWKEEDLDASKQCCLRAGRTPREVYVGVDVFARNCIGGFDSYKSVELISDKLLSTALFAPSWTHEACDGKDFEGRESRFWSSLNSSGRKLSSLPLVTTFNRGHGKHYSSFGKRLHSNSWFNLSLQSMQALPCGMGEVCDGMGTREGSAFMGSMCVQVDMTTAVDVDLFKMDIELQSDDFLFVSFVSRRLITETSQPSSTSSSSSSSSLAITLTLNSLQEDQTKVLKFWDSSLEPNESQLDNGNIEKVLNDSCSDKIEKEGWSLNRYKYKVCGGMRLQKVALTADPLDVHSIALLGYLQISKEEECYLSVLDTCIVKLSMHLKGLWEVQKITPTHKFDCFKVVYEGLNEMNEGDDGARGVFLSWDFKGEVLEGCGRVFDVFVEESEGHWKFVSFMPSSIVRLDSLMQQFRDATELTFKIECHLI